MEDCVLRKSGCAGDEPNNVLLKLDGQHVIFRFNYGWDSCDAGWASNTHDDFTNGSVGNIKVYNNTFYGCGRIADNRTIDVFTGIYHRVDQLNNIYDEMKGTYKQDESPILQMFERRAIGEALDGFPNEWKGGLVSGNIAKVASTAPEGTSVTVRLQKTGGSNENYTWTTVDNTYPNEWTTSNVAGTSPTYQGNPQLGERTKAAFLPNGGIAQGAAVRHAQANGAGVAATVLTVDAGQSRRFYDGWGMSSIGESGDWIKIGTGLPVQIIGINYTADTIDLASARTWADNDAVILCLTTDGVNFQEVNSIGAGQVGAIVVPPPSPGAPSLSTRVVVLR